LAFTPFELAEVINRATIPANAHGLAKGLSFRLELAANLPRRVLGDPRRITQVLSNLLANAVKFTEQGQVALSAHRDGDWLLFRVSDTGIGMTPEHLERAFRPFEQGDGSLTRRYGGTGLGLALTHHLVQKMGGTIEVESIPGGGTTFDVRLPLAETGEPAWPGGAHATGSRRLSGISVLCIDDSEITRLILGDLMVSEGATVTLAAAGLSALERLAQDGTTHYSLVLTDVRMPDMDGYELARRIHEVAPSLPILGLVSDLDHRDAQHRCDTSGLLAYLVKPIDPQELLEAVLRHARPPST
jgi:CheY-like chemotaxis protein/anti-sigma regulatory factor (Ser/Thr protein kinase)